ncbi:hypothetical protein LTS10_012250 [Elasticomyces elasticus]|nr:hypothetical protein LTS10_012250 [Elasticomyces elasticus]
MDRSTLASTPEFQHLLQTLAVAREGLKAKSGPRNFGYQSSSYKSEGFVPTCNDLCEICVRHYLSLQRQSIQKYSHVHSDPKAKKALLRLTQSTAANLAAVKASIALYGNTIIRRWKGKNIAKRTTLLLKAKPDIYPRKWLMADLFEQCMRRSTGPPKKLQHDISLLPFLDLATLSESPHPLLILLHARTAHNPAVWTSCDSEQLNFQFSQDLVELSYNPHCVCLQDGSEYGMLVPYNDKALHRVEIQGYPRAHLVLQAQHALSDFLKQMIDLILVDGPIEGDDEWQKLVAKDFRGQPSTLHTIAFYSMPPQFSIDAIENAFKERHAIARKELFRVQTDPYYLRQILTLFQTARCYRDSSREWQQELLVTTSIRSYAAVEHWKILEEEATKFRAKHGSSFDGLASGALLAPDAEVAMRMFQQLIIEVDVQSCGELSGSAYTLSSAGKTKDMDSALSLTLVGLIGDHLPKQASSDSRDHIFRILHADAVARDQALAAIRYRRPQIGKALSTQEMGDRDKISNHDFFQYATNLHIIHLKGAAPLVFSEVFRPLQALLALPSPDKVTKDSLGNFDEAHLAMAEFWEALEARGIGCYNSEGMSIERVIGIACSPKSPEYIETLRVTREELEAKVRELEDRTRADKPAAEPTSYLQPLQTTWGSVLAEAVSPATPKEKPKTRPANVEVPQIEDLQIEPPDEQLVEQRFIELAKQRSLDLFQRMYTPSTCAKGTASVKWRNFVAALSDAGCSSVDGPGSSLKFVLKGWGTESVSIHRGHPDDTINPIMLGEHGRSFAGRWGWCYDTFKLREEA